MKGVASISHSPLESSKKSYENQSKNKADDQRKEGMEKKNPQNRITNYYIQRVSKSMVDWSQMAFPTNSCTRTV